MIFISAGQVGFISVCLKFTIFLSLSTSLHWNIMRTRGWSCQVKSMVLGKIAH